MFEHDFLEYLPLRATGALHGSEALLLEQHLKNGCDVCESELVIFEETIARMPYALPDKPLPAFLKGRIDEVLNAEPVSQAKTVFPRRLQIAAALCIVAIAAWMFFQQAREIQRKESMIGGFQKELQLQKKEIEWLREPSVQLALLTGMDPAPGATARLIWNPVASRGMFYASSLPALTPGKSYQLWAIGKGNPVSAGVFGPDSRGQAVIEIVPAEGSPSAVIQFAVTIEPSGGLPQPSGAMILAGKTL